MEEDLKDATLDDMLARYFQDEILSDSNAYFCSKCFSKQVGGVYVLLLYS